MSGYDFFFSHHSDSSKALVAEVTRLLQGSGIRGWYAERDIEGSQNYTEMIMGAIRDCRLFVLLLNKYSNASRHVMREVNLAMANARPMLFLRLDDCTPSDAIAYASSASQIITVKEENATLLAKRVSEEIFHWFATHGDGTPVGDVFSNEGYKSSWDGNDLAFYADEGERHRIEQQRRFVYSFAHEVYDEFLSRVPEDAVYLDIGGNTGEQSAMFLEKYPHVKYVGVDREEIALERGRALMPNAHFYNADCEANDFDELLDELQKKHAPRGFDIINISLFLLHTKNPELLLDRLSVHLSPEGRLIILDIDDGFNVAHPDPEKRFKKAIDLCFGTAYSGFRHCGRTVFGFLNDLGLSDIRLHKTGLSTVGMNRRERESFFDVYFWIILDDLRKMHASHPDSALIKSDLDWIEENYDELRMLFKKKSFFFSLGFMLFSAGAEA